MGQEPGQGNLVQGRPMALGHPVQCSAFFERARREWEPWDKRHAISLGVLYLILPLSVADVVAILHRNNWNELSGSIHFLGRNLGKADVTDESLALEFLEGY